jgi:hypothetical protein
MLIEGNLMKMLVREKEETLKENPLNASDHAACAWVCRVRSQRHIVASRP